MCACKPYAFKHKRTHEIKYPFLSVESKKCNGITGPICTNGSFNSPTPLTLLKLINKELKNEEQCFTLIQTSTISHCPPAPRTSLEHSAYVSERLHHLVHAFTSRTHRVKEQITQPPTPSTELSDGGGQMSSG